MIKAVILDLDDTLCLTEAACFDMENETLAAMGREPMTRATHRANWGKPLFEAIFDRSPGIDLEEFKRYYEPTIKHYTEEGLLDVIPEENYKALDRLLALGKSLVVLTSRTHTELKHMLDGGHELASRIETFYYRDNMQYHKPDSRAFAHIEVEHGRKPEECVYIGDSVTDAIAANGAGLQLIISLESGLRTREDFADQSVERFINVFPEVVDAVQSLDK